MRATIDRAGRLVVPKTYRDRLGLRPGQELHLEETDAGLLLVPVATPPRVVETPEGPVIVAEEDQDAVLTDEHVRALLESGRP